MAWLLIPLPYLYAIWRTERYLAQATACADDTAKHGKNLLRAMSWLYKVEALQIRFPSVTGWIDQRLHRQAERNQTNI